MKLHETINSSHIFTGLSPIVASKIIERLCSAEKLIDLNSTSDLCRLGDTYAIRKNGEPLGWIELGEQATINKKKYETLKFIFFVEEARKTRAVGLFLLGLKKVLKNPLILGSDDYGGVLFADGELLVKSLGDSRSFTVKALNLKTGETLPLDAEEHLTTKKHITLIFEEDEFPLYHDAGMAGIFYLFEDTK